MKTKNIVTGNSWNLMIDEIFISDLCDRKQ